MRGTGKITPGQARAIAIAQDAYGIWNTGPAWNRYHALKRARQGPVRRCVGRLAGRMFEGIVLAVSWALVLAPFLGWWL